MSAAPASPLPPPQGVPPLRHWPLLLRHALRAAGELALARRRFARLDLRRLARGNDRLAETTPPPPGGPAAATIAWAAYTLPRVSRIVPFRADCLVQALAAQRWLAAHGVEGKIVIGVEKPGDGAFGAHAWFLAGGRVVTGGDTARYTALL